VRRDARKYHPVVGEMLSMRITIGTVARGGTIVNM